MKAKFYGDRHGAPPPPDHLWKALGEAGKSGDPVALGIAQAAYRAWLDEQGIPWRHQGSQRPDEAQR